MDEHRFAGIESDAHGHRAVCTCGWRSQRFSTAGLAGSVWDEHRAAAPAVPHRESPAG